MTNDRLTALLTTLCCAPGISGSEQNAAAAALAELRTFCPDAHLSHGNVTATFGNTAPDAPHILLDAHIDQVGMIVTSVTEDGFVTVGNVGGIDRRLLPAQRVRLYGTKVIDGVICCMPPHLTNGSEKPMQWEEVRIDTGYPAEELKALLHPGDAVTFCGKAFTLPGGKFAAPALDDRCGVAAILCAVEELYGEDIPNRVTVQFSVQEEIGEIGAKIGCYAANPDIALAVDVSFAGDGKLCESGIMGDGPMIGFSPSLYRYVTDQLFTTANENHIPWQHEVMHELTSTNADQFAICRAGVKTCTVSIPIENMHTPVEVVELSDILNTGKLLAAYVRRDALC